MKLMKQVEYVVDNENQVDSWQEVTLVYSAALKQINTKLEILNDEFQHVHRYNPIEHIKSRMKTSESIVKKLKRYGYESTIENMVKYINDIAGIRVICSFTSDIYRIADMIGNQNDIKVISVKDYIKHPKASGYKSYHMLVTVPVFLSDRIVEVKWKSRSGRSPWISGPAWNIKSIINLKEMPPSILRRSLWNAQGWCRIWMRGCCR